MVLILKVAVTILISIAISDGFKLTKPLFHKPFDFALQTSETYCPDPSFPHGLSLFPVPGHIYPPYIIHMKAEKPYKDVLSFIHDEAKHLSNQYIQQLIDFGAIYIQLTPLSRTERYIPQPVLNLSSSHTSSSTIVPQINNKNQSKSPSKTSTVMTTQKTKISQSKNEIISSVPIGTYIRLHVNPRRHPSVYQYSLQDWQHSILHNQQDFLVISKPTGSIPTGSTVDNNHENILSIMSAVLKHNGNNNNIDNIHINDKITYGKGEGGFIETVIRNKYKTHTNSNAMNQHRNNDIYGSISTSTTTTTTTTNLPPASKTPPMRSSTELLLFPIGRLDACTSGCLMLAKSAKSAAAMNELMRSRESYQQQQPVRKIYTLLCHDKQQQQQQTDNLQYSSAKSSVMATNVIGSSTPTGATATDVTTITPPLPPPPMGVIRHGFRRINKSNQHISSKPNLLRAYDPSTMHIDSIGQKWQLAELIILSKKSVYLHNKNQSLHENEVNIESSLLHLWECEVELITGRTHQIRLQMTALGYPLYGDTRYIPVQGLLDTDTDDDDDDDDDDDEGNGKEKNEVCRKQKAVETENPQITSHQKQQTPPKQQQQSRRYGPMQSDVVEEESNVISHDTQTSSSSSSSSPVFGPEPKTEIGLHCSRLMFPRNILSVSANITSIISNNSTNVNKKKITNSYNISNNSTETDYTDIPSASLSSSTSSLVHASTSSVIGIQNNHDDDDDDDDDSEYVTFEAHPPWWRSLLVN